MKSRTRSVQTLLYSISIVIASVWLITNQAVLERVLAVAHIVILFSAHIMSEEA